MKYDRKLRVGVIFGGRSGEHEVSLASAGCVMAAMDRDKYELVPIGITKAGQWLRGEDVHARLLEQATHPSAGEGGPHEPSLCLSESGPLDLIFPVLHGPFGEDGTVQGFLELAGVPYVGAGVTGSAVGMDKALTKDIWRAHGLPVLPYRVFLRKVWQSAPSMVVAACEEVFTYPMFVKPANLGSSIGIHKAHHQAELRAGLEDAARYDRKLLVEQGIEAREIEVSVMGNDEPIASPVGEIIPSREFYSYAAKYLDNTSKLIIPAPITPAQTALAQQLAVQAFQSLDCTGLARCDFLLDKASGELFLNEVNTMPGFTPISMYPKLWGACGMPYATLIDRLIELALERHEERRQLQTTFDVGGAE
jgi:D-alanine-D-alanine ligase